MERRAVVLVLEGGGRVKWLEGVGLLHSFSWKIDLLTLLCMTLLRMRSPGFSACQVAPLSQNDCLFWAILRY